MTKHKRRHLVSPIDMVLSRLRTAIYKQASTAAWTPFPYSGASTIGGAEFFRKVKISKSGIVILICKRILRLFR
jgi:hypothetical protein